MALLNVELVGRLDLDVPLRHVAVQNGHAYLGTGADLLDVDVRDPTHPVVRGHAASGVGQVQAIALDGERAYVGGANGLAILAISREYPRILGTCSTPSVRAVIAAPPYVYLSAGCLRVIDVSDGTHPIQVGGWDVGQGAYALAARGPYIYLGDAMGLEIIDVSAPTAPRCIYECSTAAFPEDATLAGSYLYLASEHSGLRIVDLADPAIPDDIGHFNTWRDIPDSVIDGESGNAQAVAAASHHAYVVFANDGLRIIDVANPTTPAEVGFYPVEGAVDIAVAGAYVYLATRSDGLHILQASPSQL
jgi:hypothetical protein